MASEKLISLLFAGISLYCGSATAEQRSVIEVENRGSCPTATTQTVVVPPDTKATLTTELSKLGATKNLSLELLIAIYKDDVVSVRSAVAAGANINQEMGGNKPLAIAIINKKYKAFEALLELGADYNIMCEGLKLIFYCIRNDSRSTRSISCNSNCDSSCGTESCSTNCGSCSTDCDDHPVNPAVLLIKKGADLSSAPYGRQELICAAVQHADIELATELIKKGYDASKITQYILVHIIQQPKMLELFLKNGFNPNQSQIIEQEYFPNGPWTALTIAVTENLQSVQLLLDAGADINLAAPRTPISYAMDHGDIEIIKLLVAHGAQL